MTFYWYSSLYAAGESSCWDELPVRNQVAFVHRYLTSIVLVNMQRFPEQRKTNSAQISFNNFEYLAELVIMACIHGHASQCLSVT